MAASVNGRSAYRLLRYIYPATTRALHLSRRVYQHPPLSSSLRQPRQRMSVVAGGATAPTNGSYSNVPGTNWTVDLMPGSYPETIVSQGDISSYPSDFLAVGVYSEAIKVETDQDGNEKVSYEGETLKTGNKALNEAIADILAKGDFKGEPGQSAIVRVGGGDVKNVGLFGLGKSDEAILPAKWGRSVYYKFGAGVGGAAKGQKFPTVTVTFDATPKPSIADVGTHLITGLLVDPYESTRYKEKPKENPLKTITLLNLDSSVESGVKKAHAIAEGTGITMYLVESPPNVCYPQHIADTAAMIAGKFPETISLKVLEKEDCEKMNMGLYLGVANASETPPKFIHMTYTKGTPKETLALVGKGITMDTGGYNLKISGSRIEEMKFDMGGAGAVLGAAYILGSLSPDNISVHFIIASCENMISGKGYRPGDIIKASNGKSVEVINTDAEGRLTLADALLYAQNECKATSIINMATLTGAIVVALGEKIAGLFTPSDAMATAIEAAAKRTGDRLWRLPMDPEYLDMLTKGIADLTNVGSRAGGSITAALFLKEFVKTDDVEWAHIDIAGTAWSAEKKTPTGYGAAIFAEWVLAKAAS